MNIINDGDKIRYSSKICTGTCINCGCEFETKINTVQGNALTRYVPEEGIEITKISGNTLWCSCPQCEYKYIPLKEVRESGEE